MSLFESIGDQVETVGCTEAGTMETDSMCPRCEHDGSTRIMLVKIPFFRELIVSSFECFNEECGERNNSIQFGGTLEPKGWSCSLLISNAQDLNRQVVRSEYCTLRIVELELENPPSKGEITTVEGLISGVAAGLQQDQAIRRALDPELADKLDAIISKIESYRELKFPFTIEMTDPSGNSYIQNPHAPQPDSCLHVTHFVRSKEDDIMLGLRMEYDKEEEKEEDTHCKEEASSSSSTSQCAEPSKQSQDQDYHPASDYNTRRTGTEEAVIDDGHLELGYSMPETCFACKRPGFINMAVIDIPHFKETILMSFKCDACGFVSNEIKTGGVIPPYGTRMLLKVETIEDLSRDVLKSHSCQINIPELDFEMSEGSLGSMFTTVEGLLQQMHSQLQSLPMCGFVSGDSSNTGEKSKWKILLDSLQDMISGKTHFTLKMEDPLSHSYLQRLAEEDEEDPRLLIERFERTSEQNEDFGTGDDAETGL